MKMAVPLALHHSAQRVEEPREEVEGGTYDAPRRQKPPRPETRPASLAEPRGDVVQVQRHTVEQLAADTPRLPTLDVPVQQKVDQLVAVPARYDTPIPEQVNEVPKISCPHPLLAHSSSHTADGGTAGGIASVLCPRGHDHGTVRARGTCSQGRMGGTRGGWRVQTTTRGPLPEGITASPGRYTNAGHRDAG